eukprot:CAMPEP_0172872360 /NCGR_PEP_ID=MMETSP1075-20121228/92592_1 /TAXON_ID=2916 /ORGANISM="Ceratium fusus, Strain PA161109" /LENGTH=122 /DNA_ID=CAMNT_0013722683 /DNA_START=726 /DNA_END=1093 /DNA_ORIENTATION=-
MSVMSVVTRVIRVAHDCTSDSTWETQHQQVCRSHSHMDEGLHAQLQQHVWQPMWDTIWHRAAAKGHHLHRASSILDMMPRTGKCPVGDPANQEAASAALVAWFPMYQFVAASLHSPVTALLL